MEALVRVSDALAASGTSLTPPLIPAMSGCVDCGTISMIASPGPMGSCPHCGSAHVGLTPEQVRRAVSGEAAPIVI